MHRSTEQYFITNNGLKNTGPKKQGGPNQAPFNPIFFRTAVEQRGPPASNGYGGHVQQKSVVFAHVWHTKLTQRMVSTKAAPVTSSLLRTDVFRPSCRDVPNLSSPANTRAQQHHRMPQPLHWRNNTVCKFGKYCQDC